ncbi:MAG: hypothetical protein AAF363_02630 [Bacteroidota bacterium]
MKSIQYFFIGIISLSLFSCQDPPELSDIPRIEFQDLRVIDATNSPFDTIVIDVLFEDGNADLGLLSTEINRPYHEIDYIFRSDQNTESGLTLVRARDLNEPEFETFILSLENAITVQGNTLSLNFRDSSSFTSADAPPLFVNSGLFNGFNWVVSGANDQIVAATSSGDVISFDSGSPPTNVGFAILDTIRQTEDTVWVEQNRFNRNYFVELLQENSQSGDFAVVDLADLLGPSGANAFDARFILIRDNLNSEELAVEGTITRRIATTSFGFLFVVNPQLRNSNLRFRIQIADRNLNLSNVVETSNFRPADFDF